MCVGQDVSISIRDIGLHNHDRVQGSPLHPWKDARALAPGTEGVKVIGTVSMIRAPAGPERSAVTSDVWNCPMCSRASQVLCAATLDGATKLPQRSVLGKSSHDLCRFLKRGRSETLLHDLHVSTRRVSLPAQTLVARVSGDQPAARAVKNVTTEHMAFFCNEFACRTPPALLRHRNCLPEVCGVNEHCR